MGSRTRGLTKIVSLGAYLLMSQAHATAISHATIRYATGGLENSVASALGQGMFKSSDINIYADRPFRGRCMDLSGQDK